MSGDDFGFDLPKEAERITSFIGRTVGGAAANGVVVGLSGGVDSAVTGALCVRALGRRKVLAILMPSEHTPEEDFKDARALVASWGVRSAKVPVGNAVKEIVTSAGIRGTRVARANVEARVRMSVLYFYGNAMGYLVAGTGDRSETLLGYFTKWGDGAADLLPIAHLYKTEVRRLGAHLGLPRRVVEKPASPRLWQGHKATDELPAPYEQLDVVLRQVFDLKRKPGEAAAKAGLSAEAVEEALRLNRKTGHKRALPASLGQAARKSSHPG